MGRALTQAVLFMTIIAASHGQAPPTDQASPKPASCTVRKTTWTPGFGSQLSIQGGKKLPADTTLGQDDHVDIKLDLDCAISSPEYSSIIFTSSAGPKAAFLLKPAGSSQVKGSVKAADLAEKGGTFDIEVHVGDSNMLPLSASIGSVAVLSRDGKHPVSDPPPSKYNAQFAPRPEIRHVHRAEHKQPPKVVPLIAVLLLGAVLVGWLFLLPGFAPKEVAPGSKTLAALCLSVLLATTLAFAVWFWLRMTLLDALLPLVVLAASMVLVGHAALSSLANARIGAQSKAVKSD